MSADSAVAADLRDWLRSRPRVGGGGPVTAIDIEDRLLDALDEAPIALVDNGVTFAGRVATIQWLSSYLGCSDSTTRDVVHHLRRCGMVRMFDVKDPTIGKRRLLVTGEAAQ